MAKGIPQLAMLQAFEAAGRLGSLRAAAQELNLTPSAISHRISALESLLEVALFERKGRGLALTREGRSYLGGIRPGLDQLRTAADRIRHPGVAGPLTIRLYPTFAQRWLIPRLPDFTRQYPDVELHLVNTQQPLDFSAGETDLAIEHASGPLTGYCCDRLVQEEVVPVCSEALYVACGRPDRWAALNGMDRLHCSLHPDEWRWWLEKVGFQDEFSGRNHHMNTRDSVIAAVEAGLGVGMAHLPLINDTLREKQLIAPFGPPVPKKTPYSLITTPERYDLARVAAFRDWILVAAKSA